MFLLSCDVVAASRSVEPRATMILNEDETLCVDLSHVLLALLVFTAKFLDLKQTFGGEVRLPVVEEIIMKIAP